MSAWGGDSRWFACVYKRLNERYSSSNGGVLNSSSTSKSFASAFFFLMHIVMKPACSRLTEVIWPVYFMVILGIIRNAVPQSSYPKYSYDQADFISPSTREQPSIANPAQLVTIFCSNNENCTSYLLPPESQLKAGAWQASVAGSQGEGASFKAEESYDYT